MAFDRSGTTPLDRHLDPVHPPGVGDLLGDQVDDPHRTRSSIGHDQPGLSLRGLLRALDVAVRDLLPHGLRATTGQRQHRERRAVVGPNGSGKSTLLGAPAGVIAPAEGAVEIGTRRPAFVVQHSAVPAGLPITVRETVDMGRWAHRGPWRRLSTKAKELVDAALERMGVTDLAARRLSSRSGSQRQRALLAQAFAQESDLLPLDEPDAGPDARSRLDISAAISNAQTNGVTGIHVTHDLDEASRADDCLLLQNGRLTAEGHPRTVLPRLRAEQPQS